MAIALTGYTFSTGSSVSRISNLRQSIADDGSARYLDLGATVHYSVGASVEGLTEAERDALTDWLDTNEAQEIDLDFGTVTYRGRLDPNQDISWTPNAGLFNVDFTIRATKV